MKDRLGLPNLADFIYPHLAGSARAREVAAKRHWRKLARDDGRAVAALGSDVKQLEHYSAEISKLLDREQSRRQSVESRLTSIIGMTSIAATVVMGASVSLAAGTLPGLPRLAAVLFAIGSLYLVLQLFSALIGALSGLSRSGQLEETAADLFETGNAAHAVRLRRDITRKLEQLRDYRRGIDARVSQMAVAHQAIRNFLVGLLLLALGAAWFAITRDAGIASNNDGRAVVESRQDRAQAPREDFTAIAPRSRLSEPIAGGLRESLLKVAGGVLLFVVGAALFVKGRQTAGAVLAGGGLLLSLLGGNEFEFEIGKFDKLIGELKFELFKPAERPPLVRPALIRVAMIGPFPGGDHVLDRERVLHCLRQQMTREFMATVGGWQIVGRVDKRQLKPQPALLYGSNQTLAMKRATWVRDQIVGGIQEAAVAQSVVSVGGAQGVGGAVSETEMERDRSVDIYALVAQSADERGRQMPALPLPVVCPAGRIER